MKAIVCGGRKYSNYQMMNKVLDHMHEAYNFKLIIHGNAPGADVMAGMWANSAGVQEVRCPSNATKYKTMAGLIRNSNMLLLNPDAIIHFPGDSGTADMVKKGEFSDLLIFDGADIYKELINKKEGL